MPRIQGLEVMCGAQHMEVCETTQKRKSGGASPLI